MKTQNFVHLHVHSDYSILDGCATIRQIVGTAIKHRMSGIAITDKCSMGGIMDFFDYVNRLRLAHADRYRQVNRQASQEEVALASGFSSRQSYYSVRKRMEKIDKQNMSVVAE